MEKGGIVLYFQNRAKGLVRFGGFLAEDIAGGFSSAERNGDTAPHQWAACIRIWRGIRKSLFDWKGDGHTEAYVGSIAQRSAAGVDGLMPKRVTDFRTFLQTL